MNEKNNKKKWAVACKEFVLINDVIGNVIWCINNVISEQGTYNINASVR